MQLRLNCRWAGCHDWQRDTRELFALMKIAQDVFSVGIRYHGLRESCRDLRRLSWGEAVRVKARTPTPRLHHQVGVGL